MKNTRSSLGFFDLIFLIQEIMDGVCYVAEDLLAYYDENFIRTKKDRRKVMMLDYREVIQDCQIHMGAHGYPMKELASAQRPLNKVMSEL
ncbi:hypothetical protein RIE95_02785 [Acidithiobacillus thiooxidans]|uniref:hypothetical protein n=1 Tax=Acidithiobacillus thiooxidans TaxID=930 RepID=UPI0028571ED0|nr:hypothetical protein [Acidithiobacillus thiooxidans]MDR7925927.1 hypothetical protein [Acidithiobacillus thiooxidans]